MATPQVSFKPRTMLTILAYKSSYATTNSEELHATSSCAIRLAVSCFTVGLRL